jgi:ParB family chromosome partitioning protein
MTFKDTAIQFQMLSVTEIEPDPAHPRQQIDEDSLKGLVNAIAKKGLIHPLVVQPADSAGRYRLIVGERRWRAAMLAGEQTVPALIHACPPDEIMEVRIFENLGLGVRAALEPRDMANAIQNIAQRFETPEAAADHFGRNAAWLSQATAAAKLSPKVSALLDSGKITSTGAAVQLEKLALKNEARAETLIVQTEQLPEGEKLAKKVIDTALSEEGSRHKKARAVSPVVEPETLPVEPPVARLRVNPGKFKMVAELLGLDDGDEEEILVRLIDEFLMLKGEGNA